MAKCPKCNKVWKWDFQQDCYRDSKGEFCNDIEFELELNGEGDAGKITVYQCKCGKVLGIMNDLGSVDVIAGWKEIDWEADEHCFTGNWQVARQEA